MPKQKEEEHDGNQGKGLTCRQFFVLRLVIKGKGKTLTGDVRKALGEKGVEITLVTNSTNLKHMERNGWITAKVGQGEVSDGTTRPVNSWKITKLGLEVFERAKALLTVDKPLTK